MYADDDDVMMASATTTNNNQTDATGATNTGGSTTGLFKKSKKARGAAAAGSAGTNGAAGIAAAGTAAVAASSSSSSSSRRNASASLSRLSFDDEADGAAEAAAGGVDSLALRLRLDKEKRKQAKRTERAATAAATLPAAPLATLTTVGSGSSGGAYTPEALAALRNNAKHFSSGSSAGRLAAPTHSSSSSGLMDGEEMEPEANLAALRRSPDAGSPMALGVGLGLGAAMTAGSFRASGRSKQLALQEADDLRRMGAASKAKALGDVAAAEDEDGALSRAEELERLAQERQIRAAKLKRERMRATGALGAGEIASGHDNDDVSFIPLRSSTALAASRGDDAEGRVAELDRNYGVAVRDDSDDEHEANSRVLRDDADDALLPEYDDGEDPRSDRLAFGDPAARGRRPGDQGSHTQIGALLNKSSRSAAARAGRGDSRRNALMVDDDDAEEAEGGMEDDEETRRWEEQMIRAGGAKLNSNGEPVRPPATTRGAQRSSATGLTSVAAPTTLAQQIESSTAAASAASGTAASLVDPGDVLRAGLTTQLNAMVQSYDKLNARFRGVEKALLAEEQQQRQLDSQMESASEQYTFYQQLSEQIITSLDCLGEKGRDIRAAWDEMHELKRARAAELADAVQQHEKDLWAESGFYTATGAADATMHAAAPPQPQLDEFGRDMSIVQESAAERRKEARTEWFRQQLQAQSVSSTGAPPVARFPPPNPLGWSSWLPLVEQEDSAGSSRFASSVASLLADSTLIFSDTAPPFRSMDGVKGWMEEWKRKYRASYTEAYIPASMPLILAPYVQLELLQKWDLLRQPHFSEPAPTTKGTDGGSASEPSWYTKLFDYGMEASNVPMDGSGSGSASGADDEDSHLLPTLIESVLVPLVRQFIALEFDPASLDLHVPALYACIQEVEAHLLSPGQSGQWQQLLTQLMEVFQQRIAAHQQRFELVPQLDADSSAAARDPDQLVRQEAYARFRFFQALNLFASLTHFQSLLPTASVKQLASQHLVAALLPFLAWKCVQVDAAFAQGEEAAAAALATGRRAAASSSSLLAASVDAETPLQQLQSMGARFKAVFPQQWLASKQAAGSASSANSMTQLYDSLDQLQRASDSRDAQLVQATVKQLRALLHR